MICARRFLELLNPLEEYYGINQFTSRKGLLCRIDRFDCSIVWQRTYLPRFHPSTDRFWACARLGLLIRSFSGSEQAQVHLLFTRRCRIDRPADGSRMCTSHQRVLLTVLCRLAARETTDTKSDHRPDHLQKVRRVAHSSGC